MKVLYIDRIGGNPENVSKENHQTIKGASIFEWSLVSALLEHGTYDAYLSPGLTEEKRQALVQEGLGKNKVKRLACAPVGEPLPVNESDQVVFLTAGRFLNALSTIRQKLKRYDAPVCGFIHSINSARIVFALLQQCFAGLSEADLLFCSSQAGIKTIDVYVHEINRSLPPELRYPAKRVLVPLGVNLATADQTAGVRLRQRCSLETDSCIALYFGRLSQRSKCDLGPLLVALAQLLRRGKNLYLVIAGDDTQTREAPRLESLASELGCSKNVKIWPNPSAGEKHLLYSGADFFLSPSDNTQETFGLTVAEAMAYGLPAVVSDWNGYRDLVKDNENGFLIPSVLPSVVESLRLCDCTMSMLEEDLLAQSTTIDVSVLSEKMERLASDQGLRLKMGKAARRFVENTCSWRAVVKRYEESWEESLHTINTDGIRLRKSSQLLDLPLEKCFGHYATLKRDQAQRCFITAEGREWLKRPARLYFLSPLSASPNPTGFAKMLRQVSDNPGISVADMARSFSNGAGNASDAHWMLERLFKYGLVAEKADS